MSPARIMSALAMGCLAALLVGGCGQADPGFPVHPDMPRGFQRYLERRVDLLVVRSDGGLTVLGHDREVADQTLLRARQALTRYHRWFPEAPRDLTLCIVLADGPEWRQLADREGLRPDGIAFHAPGLLVLKDDPDQNRRPDRLPHELIHAILEEQFAGQDVPLWVHEGWAGFYGWELARMLSDGREEWTRRRPAMPETAPLPPEVLMTLESYPPAPATARMFYRQTEETVRALEEELARRAMPELLDDLVREGLSLSDALVVRRGWHPQRLQELAWRVQQRCRMERILR